MRECQSLESRLRMMVLVLLISKYDLNSAEASVDGIPESEICPKMVAQAPRIRLKSRGGGDHETVTKLIKVHGLSRFEQLASCSMITRHGLMSVVHEYCTRKQVRQHVYE